MNITAGALNIVSSQHGDTVIGAKIGDAKFSLNTSKGTMTSGFSGSSGITAGENLITSLDDLMSKTDSMAEANRKKAVDKAKAIDLDKIKGDPNDPRYKEKYVKMSEEDIRKDIKTRSESGDLVKENVEGIARGESRGDGFLENTLGNMKDDLMGAIGVTADKDGYTDASGEYHQRTCFVKGSMISTLEGQKTIESLKLGDKALSWNPETGKLEYRTITNLFERKTDLIYKLTFSSGRSVETTWNHPFYVSGRGFIETKDLKVGDVLKTASSSPLTLKAISTDARVETVYNFEVERNHTYFVGEDGVLVHNQAAIYAPIVTACATGTVGCAIGIGIGIAAITHPDETKTILDTIGGYVSSGWEKVKGFMSEGENDVDSKNLSDKTKDIANKTGLTDKEVKEKIHDLKKNLPKPTSGERRNPDVQVDTKTGEVYPKLKNGELGDSIGNIFD